MLAIGALIFASQVIRAAPATLPAPGPALAAKLADIDRRGARITTLWATFEQQKFTAMLRKPLTTSGAIAVNPSAMRWDTQRPQKNVLLITDKQVEVYYPDQASLEVYDIDAKIADLASSPLPRLGVLKEKFSIAEIPAAQLTQPAPAVGCIALKLLPLTDDLRQHVQQVCVLVNIAGGYVVQAEYTDADDDRTVIRFGDVKLNGAVGDLSLKVPAGTKISHPLKGVSGGSMKDG